MHDTSISLPQDYQYTVSMLSANAAAARLNRKSRIASHVFVHTFQPGFADLTFGCDQSKSTLLDALGQVIYVRHKTQVLISTLCLDSWFLPASILLQLQQLYRHLDVIFQIVLSIQSELGRLAFVLLDVEADRGTAAARP